VIVGLSSDFYEFGDFRLNLNDKQLSRNGVCIPMPPRVFDTLVLLVTAKGQLVDKDYLLQQLWPDTFVEEGALAHNISLLRKALGESAGASTFIQTVPKRGYRFLAPIHTASRPAPSVADLPGAEIRRPAVNAKETPTKTDRRIDWIRRRNAWGMLAAGGVALVVTVGWSIMRVESAWRVDSGAAHFAPITRPPIFATDPTLSRDGTLVAYASSLHEADNLDIWVQRVDGGDPTQVTSDVADEREPNFSPDGTLIAFRSEAHGGGIYVTQSTGVGGSRLVTELGRRPRFSPDGSQIAFWMGEPGQAGSYIYLVPSIGGPSVQLARGFGFAKDPIWAPDGQSVLFFGRRMGKGAITDWWWLPLHGSDPVSTGALSLLAQKGLTMSRLGVLPSDEVVPAMWSADGVYFSATLDGAVNLWRLSVSSLTGHVNGPLVRMTQGPGEDRVPFADATGRLAFQRAGTSETIQFLPLAVNEGKSTGGVERVSDGWPMVPHSVSTSDDGHRVVFTVQRTTTTELWIKDLNAGQERHLVSMPLPAPMRNPLVSRAGRLVAFTRGTAGYMISVADGRVATVCDPCLVLAWLDEQRLLITTPAHKGLQALNVSIGARDDVLGPHSLVIRATPSPDRRWVVVFNGRALWISPVHPGTPVPEKQWFEVPLPVIANIPALECGWSSDGRLVYFLLGPDGFRCLYALRFDPMLGQTVGEPFLVEHLHNPGLSWGGPQTSWNDSQPAASIISDGLLFEQFESTGNVWLRDPHAR
jgi:DNA-binding winged helix-turn-helix (wHTH) protein/Tol biopolymer transport system component